MSATYDGAVRGSDPAHHVAPLRREGRLAGQGRTRRLYKRGGKDNRERTDATSPEGRGDEDEGSLDVCG